MTTYEDKLLALFSRYAGETITSQTLFEIEKAAEKEVWAHLPKKIRDSWSLHLGFSEENPGHIELNPRMRGDAPPSELEAALKSEFVDRSPEAQSGGIAGVGFGFSGDVRAEAAAVLANAEVAPEKRSETRSVAKASDAAEAPDPARVAVSVSFGGENLPSMKAEPSTNGATKQEPAPTFGGKDIAEQARVLGISLPPNSSLLQPFLEALSLATEFKARAEAAETKLAELRKLFGA